ncbi:hypothetical protein LBMAG53_16170 [Planctomycetota bacterium]|nr:hypothetical protein LBMAG53_16170 [Planctomycetota bacterium]
MKATSIKLIEAPSRWGVSAGQVGCLLRAGLMRWSTLGILAITLVLVLPLAMAMLGKKSPDSFSRNLFLSQFALWAAILIQLHIFLFLQTGRHQRVLLMPAGPMASAWILTVGLPLAVAAAAVGLGAFSTWSWNAVLTAALCMLAILAWKTRPGSSSAAQVGAGLLLMVLGYQGTLHEVILPMLAHPPVEATIAAAVAAAWQLIALHLAIRHHPVIAKSAGSRWWDRSGWAIRWRTAPASGTSVTTVADLFRHTLNLRRAMFGSWWWVPLGGITVLAFTALIDWLTGSGTGGRSLPKFPLLAVFGIMGAVGCQAIASTPVLLRRLSTWPLSRASTLACVWSATAISSVWTLGIFVALAYLTHVPFWLAGKASHETNLLIALAFSVPCCLVACAGVIRILELMPWPIVRGLSVATVFFGSLSPVFFLRPNSGMVTGVSQWMLLAGGYAVIAVITHVLAWKWWLRADLDAASRGADDLVTPQTG